MKSGGLGLGTVAVVVDGAVEEEKEGEGEDESEGVKVESATSLHKITPVSPAQSGKGKKKESND